MTNTNSDSAALSEKLKELVAKDDLTRDQKELLQAMLGVARGISNDKNGSTPTDLQQDFKEAFEPLPQEKVDMLLAYRRGEPSMIVGNPEIQALRNTNGRPSKPEWPRAVTPRFFQNPDE